MRTKIKFTSLDFKGFEDFLIAQSCVEKNNPLYDGLQYIFRFENDYGASVIKKEFSYGGRIDLFELAILKFDGVFYSTTYNTSMTSNVFGYLTNDEVLELLERIKNL